jgi:hypothetical protein
VGEADEPELLGSPWARGGHHTGEKQRGFRKGTRIAAAPRARTAARVQQTQQQSRRRRISRSHPPCRRAPYGYAARPPRLLLHIRLRLVHTHPLCLGRHQHGLVHRGGQHQVFRRMCGPLYVTPYRGAPPW